MSSDEKKKIDAVFILEIIGRPAEYIVETLNKIIQTMKEEKGVEILNTKVNEPIELKEQKGFYSTFAEVEVGVDELVYLAILLFKYMPAHIEIISPQNLSLTNYKWNDVLNEITRRLHGYEELARIMQTEKAILENKLRAALGNQENNGERKEVKEDKKQKNKKDKKKNE